MLNYIDLNQFVNTTHHRRGTDLKTLQDPLLQVSMVLFFHKVLLKSQVYNCCSNCGMPITRSLVLSGFISSEL